MIGEVEKYNNTKHFIHEIMEDGSNLTEWEDHFVNSIQEQFNKYGKISDKQYEILERIYAEKTR